MKTLEHIKSEQVELWNSSKGGDLVNMIARAYAIEAIKADRMTIAENLATGHIQSFSDVINAPLPELL